MYLLDATPTLGRPVLRPLLLLVAFAMGVCFALPSLAQEDEAATRLMIEAQRLQNSRGGEAALLEYEALVKRFPNSALAPKALVASAQIQFDLGNLDQAHETAQKLIDSYAASGEGAASLVIQARILIARAVSVSHLDDALTLLKRIPNLFGNSRFPLLEPRAEARVLAGELLIQLDDLGAAATSFVEAIEDEPRGRFTLAAQIGLGRVLALRGDRTAAMEAFQLAINEGLTNQDNASQLAVADARRRLTLLYRYWVRPGTGQAPWAETETIEASVPWKKPRGVAVDGDGDLLVVDSTLGIVRIGSEGATTVAVRNAGNPFMDNQGRRYTPVESAIQQIDPPAMETFSTGGEKPKQLDKLQAGARGILSEWYLVDKSLKGVQVFSRSGEMEATLSGDLEAVDLVVDELGRLYVLSKRPSRVTIHVLDRSAIRVVSGSWAKPAALAVDWLGNIYVLDTATNTVVVMDSSGTEIAKIQSTLPGGSALRSPTDLAVDDSGRIYLADTKLRAVYRLN